MRVLQSKYEILSFKEHEINFYPKLGFLITYDWNNIIVH